MRVRAISEASVAQNADAECHAKYDRESLRNLSEEVVSKWFRDMPHGERLSGSLSLSH